MVRERIERSRALSQDLEALLESRFRSAIEEGKPPSIARVLQVCASEDAHPAALRWWLLHCADEASEALASEAPEVGQRFGPDGRYRLLERLGSGGQGTVYRAEDDRTRREVALKILHGLDRPGTQELRRRFDQGARVLSRLHDPSICTLFDSDLSARVPYLVMQLVPGESLASKIAAAEARHRSEFSHSCIHLDSTHDSWRDPEEEGEADSGVGSSADGAAPEGGSEQEEPSGRASAGRVASTTMRSRSAIDEVVEVIESVARALHRAHLAGVVHRDVKPGNIMVKPDGEPVLMDFDMARDDQPRTHALTRLGDAFGTPIYMAPELLSEETLPSDPRSDVWALGVTLFQCVTLERPFGGATRQALFHAILHRDPPRLSRMQPSAPAGLELVIGKALEKRPARRYQTMLEFAEDLARVRAHEPVFARPIGALRRFGRVLARHPAKVAVALILSAAITGTWIASIQVAGANEALVAADADRRAARSELMAALRRVERLENNLASAELAGEVLGAVSADHPLAERDGRARFEDYRARWREMREALEARALPRDETERAHDAWWNARADSAVSVEWERLWSLEIEARVAGDPEHLRICVDRRRAWEEEHALARRRTWRFADRLDRIKHPLMVAICEELDLLLDEDSESSSAESGQ